ncbi:exopolysaccharide biosynthesis protein [Thioclava dalianensis]|uniref:Exopolysaccharide biosynthesis protein n=1 Tax=Thioclava dalianensis TaxID=1185766 RepID=A0A074U5K8_9RHOB|nr:sugar transferase [Thioclava dalianensis]KEP69922.1 exopolysaccharide biosynthesis protein [Thioclava dalianensis]SFN17413.1 Sugar transferase involved in LPS biosynthesis (colanic, teichoic acid) [Thioclava dalianensis]
MTEFTTNITLDTPAGAPVSQVAPYRAAGKRLFDILVVLAVMPILLPIIALLACLVRLDGGPAFFFQDRIGRDGRVFRMWKLRTMVVDAEEALARLLESCPETAREWEVNQKLAHDPRVTRLGAFLRRSSLDELPQFFNVLFGSMSIVGPRPFLLGQEDSYRGAMGHAYYRMRPGITGLWQVLGRSSTAFVDRVRFDERYYARMSLLTDIALCFMTVAVVFRQTGK